MFVSHARSATTPQAQAFAAVPIGATSAAKLTPALLRALTEVRERTAGNRLAVREAYAYAYHSLFTPQPARAKELAALRKTLVDRGVDVRVVLSPRGLAPYVEAVLAARVTSAMPDLPGNQLARTGRAAYEAQWFLNCFDYTKAVAYRAYRIDPSADLRFFVLMDFAAYGTMCPRGGSGERAQEPRPVVHTMIAYKKDGAWWAVSPEMDISKPELELFNLGPTLPPRLGPHFRLVDAPFVRGKDLVYAGAYDIEHPLIAGAVHPQVLKNVAASGVLSRNPSDFVCR